MDNIKTRPLLISVLFGVLSLYALSLLSDKNTLIRQNRNLIEDSRTLGKTLELIQQQNRQILQSTQSSDKEKQTLQEALEKIKKENESLEIAVKKNEAHYESIKEEKSYLEEMLINKTKQVEILNSQPQEQAPPVPSYEAVPPEGVDQAIQQKNEQLQQLNEQNRVLQEKLDRLYKTTSAKINEINIAKIALSDTVSTARKKIEDEWNTVNLGSVTTSAVSDRDKMPAEAKQPKSEGHVLAINSEHGFVVIDLGKADNLSSESTLEVKKNGQPIATLNILEIRDVMAACNIRDLQDGQRVEINDPVSIMR
jgi:hypothetical protein